MIIGIGFVAILQMTNYSVQSMQTSGERTKANYLTNVIAEDVISSRRETTGSFDNISNYLISNQLNADVCSSKMEQHPLIQEKFMEMVPDHLMHL